MVAQHRSELGNELLSAFRRPLARVFLDPDGRDEIEFDRLAKEVERIRPDDWRTNLRTAALRTVVAAAIKELADDQNPRNSVLSWQKLANLLGGWTDLPDDFARTGNFYNDRSKYAKSLQYVADSTYRTHVESLWDMLAREIEDLKPMQRVTKLTEGEKARKGPIHYVRRPDLEAKVLDALEAGHSPVVLWGESGNGKSFIAQQILREHFAGKHIAVLREGGKEGSLFDINLIESLRTAGLSPQSWTMGAKEYEFSKLLSTAGSYDIVLFDNVDERTLRRTITGVSVPTIITSRTLVEFTDATPIHVSEYSDNEALQAMQMRLADRPAQGFSAFCRAVGNRPIVIDLSCRLIALNLASFEELHGSIASDPASAIASAHTAIGPYVTDFGEHITDTIVHVYVQVAEAVLKDSRTSAVLNTILWLTGSTQLRLVVALTTEPNTELDELAVKAGVHHLRRLGILELQDEAVSINDLTLAILRGHLVGQLEETLGSFYRKCTDEPLEYESTAPQGDVETSPDCAGHEDTDGDNNKPLNFRELFLNACASELQGIRHVLGRLAPNRDLGTFILSGRGMLLLWQDQVEWFLEPSGTRQFALALERPGGMIIWAADRGPREAPASVIATIRNIHNAETSTGLLMAAIDETNSAPGPSPSFWLSSEPNWWHIDASVFPKEVAARHGIAVWSWCGTLYVPRPFDPEIDDGQCPYCCHYGAPSEESRFYIVLGSFLYLLDAGRGESDLEMRICMTRLAIARTSESFNLAVNVALLAISLLKDSLRPAIRHIYEVWILAYIVNAHIRVHKSVPASWVLERLLSIVAASRSEYGLENLEVLRYISQACRAVGDVKTAETLDAEAANWV